MQFGCIIRWLWTMVELVCYFFGNGKTIWTTCLFKLGINKQIVINENYSYTALLCLLGKNVCDFCSGF